MMKPKFYLLICIFATLSVAISCDDPLPQLPPETKEGRNTFGCLINGELVVPETSPWFWSHSSFPQASFNHAGDTLTIIGYGQGNQYFIFMVAQPTLETKTIDVLQYVSSAHSLSIQEKDVNGIQFSWIDRQGGVVSGTFSFQMKTPSDETIVVSQGRFDVQFDPAVY